MRRGEERVVERDEAAAAAAAAAEGCWRRYSPCSRKEKRKVSDARRLFADRSRGGGGYQQRSATHTSSRSNFNKCSYPGPTCSLQRAMKSSTVGGSSVYQSYEESRIPGRSGVESASALGEHGSKEGTGNAGDK